MMRTPMSRIILSMLALCLLPGSASGADIVGTVTNGTTGQPAANVSVGLLALQQRMSTVADTVTDSAGRYRLTVDASPQERFLVQASYGGANYNKAVVLFGDGDTTVDVTVYASGAKLSDLRIPEHVIFFLPVEGAMGITEAFTVRNQTDPPRAYVPREEGFRFGVTSGATGISVTVSTQSGMPLRQQSQESSLAGQRYIGYALRPGTTQVQISYSVPMAGDTFDYRAPLPLPAVARFIVIHSAGMEITSPGVEETPDTSSPDRRIFRITDQNAGSFAATVVIDAEELARFRANPPTAPAAPQQPRQSPIHLIPQPVNRVQFYITGLGLFVLGCGLYYLTLLDPTSSTSANHEPVKHDTTAAAARDTK